MKLSSQIEVRRFQPDDAQGISDLFMAVYGEHYTYAEIYLPSQICGQNLSGHWHSVVAIHNGNIVGHALLRCDSPQADVAELAMVAVHPAARNQGVATRLGGYLCDYARRLNLRGLLIKQVSSHPISQRLAQIMGFYTTGLLLDYVSSPFGYAEPESIVLGCLPLRSCALPIYHWPDDQPIWLRMLRRQFGHQTRHLDVPMASFVNLRGHCLTVDNIDEVIALPDRQIGWLGLALDDQLYHRVARLRACGYLNTGLMLTSDGNWHWLMQRNISCHCHSRLTLSSPLAENIYADVLADLAMMNSSASIAEGKQDDERGK